MTSEALADSYSRVIRLELRLNLEKSTLVPGNEEQPN